ncbi:TonB-dependent receptor [Aliikangiella coralliicola]|uniref:TonB-dependent receptor n=1 Tax=Aliikangiella coralliicola TaxID=2592383 RepID=A0A545UDQ9_9GAMM|nr:TonB-dependent receptor [Aliikangiella coralliicola]TQV87606.1 TonB-dependent receptor [Aliikangiella coralliicola]
MKKIAKRLITLGLSLCAVKIMAADTGGEIRGQVESNYGKEIANAVVTVTHKTKGTTRTISTNATGNYVLRNLPVGEYSIVVSADGYESDNNTIKIVVGNPAIIETTLGSQTTDGKVIRVVGSVIKKLDMAETTAGRAFDFQEMELMPVNANFESLILMTSGTVENGAPVAFNGASSIGGASSAENGFYLNGINITQIQSGLGAFDMPFEAIAQTNVQTSGVTAEFGGALGGIINSVSKTGDNYFKFGAEVRYDPSFGYTAHDSVRLKSTPETYSINNERDASKYQEFNVWASGPIMEDRAFFYVLYNPIQDNDEWATNAVFVSRERKSDRWFVNTEWFITDNHSVKLTAFNTQRDETRVTQNYDALTDQILPLQPGSDGKSFSQLGGNFVGLTYHGELSDHFSMDVVWGRTEEEEVPIPANDLPAVQDCSTGNCVTYSTHSDSALEPQEFTRDQFRADFQLDLENHNISFGIDQYEIDVLVNNRQNGVAVGDLNAVDASAATGWWSYGFAGVGSIGASAVNDGLADGTEFIRRRIRNRFSDSIVSSKAYYVQDSWQASNELTINLGVRFVDFENTVSSGEAYADLDGNVAPRLAAIWDIGAQGEHKIHASFGRYFQPVAARMNITQGSSAFEYFDYYENPTPGERPVLLPDGSPTRGNTLIPRFYRQNGITDPNLIASKNLKAMFSEQFSIGYGTEINGFEFSATAIFNELKRSVEDTDYGPILDIKLAELGIVNNTGQSSFYVLSNPGEEIELAYDFDGDGTVDNITLTQEDHLLPKAERKYTAFDFVLSGPLTEDFNIYAAYTWSHSRGNTEGLVKTTNGQADPGWTSDYDYGESLDFANGDLPNDRRHSVKFSGLYHLNDSMTIGVAYRGASGRPLNKLTPHPLGVDGCAPTSPWADCQSRSYVGAFYDADGNPAPRGTAGRLDWTHNFDLSFNYRNDDILDGLLLKATLYNVFAADTAIDVREWTTPREDYGIAETLQRARFLSLTARIEF